MLRTCLNLAKTLVGVSPANLTARLIAQACLDCIYIHVTNNYNMIFMLKHLTINKCLARGCYVANRNR